MSDVARALPRIGLGLVLLTAGLIKGADPAEFVRQLGTYGIFSGKAAAALAYLLIPAEVALGVALVAGFRTRWAALGGSLFMLIFMVATAYGWFTGRTEECGCFGSLVPRTPGEVLLEDAGFLLLGILAVRFARRKERGTGWKAIAVGTAAAGAVLLSASAYSLPLDSLVTELRIGRPVEKLPFRESPVDLNSGDHFVALLDLGSPDAGPLVKKLNGYAEIPGCPPVIAFYAGEVDEKTVFCFNYSPKFEVVPVLRSDLKRLFRRLPRFFRVQNGRVARVWDGEPPRGEELR